MSSVRQPSSQTRLILLGPPGAGKGTQAKMLAETLGVPHIASGDLFRYHQTKGMPLGLKAMEYMSQGMLVPDEITIAMVLEKVLPPLGQNKFLLDGFPRNLVQAQALDEAIAGRGYQIDQVIHIQVPEEKLVGRLSNRWVCRACQAPYHGETAPPNTAGTCDLCGGELYQRQDDAPDAVKVRIQVYHNQTQPLIDYYRQAGKLAHVDGVGTVKEVGERVLRSLQE